MEGGSLGVWGRPELDPFTECWDGGRWVYGSGGCMGGVCGVEAGVTGDGCGSRFSAGRSRTGRRDENRLRRVERTLDPASCLTTGALIWPCVWLHQGCLAVRPKVPSP